MNRLVAATAALLLSLAAGTLPAGAEPGVRLVHHGSRAVPVVALTFDDGWDAERCWAILETLVRRGVPATFFPYARAVARAPDFWRRVAALGYPIGNHSTTHPDMTRLAFAEATSELHRARTIVEDVTGERMIRVFRPPYGAWDMTVIEAAQAAGFPTVLLWDVDPRDWSRSWSRETKVREALRGRNGSVVLLHCGPAVTPRILERIIDGYLERGFAFVTVPQLLRGPVPGRVFFQRDRPPAARAGRQRAVEPLGWSLMSAAWAHRGAAWAV